MLNTATRKILGDLTAISSTCIVSYPKTGVQDLDRSIVAFIDLEKLGETEFEPFGLMNVSEFLSLVSLIDNADINIENRVATVKNSDVESKYYTTAISIIEEAYGTNAAILENIDKAFEAATFDITAAELDKLKKTSGFLKVPDLNISAGEGEVVLNITDTTVKDSNSYKVKVNASVSDAEMNIVLDMNNIKKIPSGAYNIKIAKNQKSGSYITKWTSLDLDCLQIVVSLAAR